MKEHALMLPHNDITLTTGLVRCIESIHFAQDIKSNQYVG